MTSASFEEVLRAIERAPADLAWASVADQVVPVMPRERPFPPGTPEPSRTMIAPGILVGFGIEIGPALLAINDGLLASWEVPLAQVAAQAIANLHVRAGAIDRASIVREQVGGFETEALQTGKSIGSTLVLAPDELRTLFGASPRRFITPMRDLIIGLPDDVDPAFALWFRHEFADLDPNSLLPIAYRFDGAVVMPEPLDGSDHSTAARAPRVRYLA